MLPATNYGLQAESIQGGGELLVEHFCLGRVVADGGEAEAAVGGDTAEHVHDDAGLAGVVEVEAGLADQVHEAFGGEDAVGGRFEVIAGDVGFGLAAGGEVLTAGWVVFAAGEVLQGEVGVGGAALAQIDLDGVGDPGTASGAGDDEVEGEAADDAFTSEAQADFLGLGGDQRGVFGVGGEAGAEVDLTAGTAEHLIVGREDFQLAEWGSAELDAGAGELVPGDKFFDDSALFGEKLEVAVVADAMQLDVHGLESLEQDGQLCGVAGWGQAAQVELGVAVTGDAFVVFDDDLGDGRFLAAHGEDGLDEVILRVQVFGAEGMRDAFLGEDAPAAALGAEGEVARIGAVHRDAQAHGQLALQIGGDKGYHVGQVEVGDGGFDLFEEARPLEQFMGEWPAGGVLGREQGQAFAGAAAGDRGQDVQVIVDDLGLDGQGCDVDQAHLGLAQEEEHEEHALFVCLLGEDVELDVVDGEGGDDDDGVLGFGWLAGGVRPADLAARGERVCAVTGRTGIGGMNRAWQAPAN